MIWINFEHLDEPFKLEMGECNVLAVENNNVFSKILYSLYNYDDDYFKIFDENYKMIPEKNTLTIFNPLEFDFDERNIKTILYNKIINQLILDQEIKLEIENHYQRLLNEIVAYIDDNNDFDFCYQEKMSLKDLLKLINLSINQAKCSSIFEKTQLLIDTLNEVSNDRLLIFTNLNIMLTAEEYRYIVDQISLNNQTVLVIESNQDEIKAISHIYLDEDFYLFDNRL